MRLYDFNMAAITLHADRAATSWRSRDFERLRMFIANVSSHIESRDDRTLWIVVFTAELMLRIESLDEQRQFSVWLSEELAQ